MFSVEYFVDALDKYETQILIDKYTSLELDSKAEDAVLFILRRRGIKEEYIFSIKQSRRKKRNKASTDESNEKGLNFNPLRVIFAVPSAYLTINSLNFFWECRMPNQQWDQLDGMAILVLLVSIGMGSVIIFSSNKVALFLATLLSGGASFMLIMALTAIAHGGR